MSVRFLTVAAYYSRLAIYKERQLWLPLAIHNYIDVYNGTGVPWGSSAVYFSLQRPDEGYLPQTQRIRSG